MKTAVVLGAGGFIGGHLVKRLKNEGYYVKGVDIKNHEFGKTAADEFELVDLRDPRKVKTCLYTKGLWNVADEIYQLAADMGGAGYIFSKEHDADVMHNSATINLNVLEAIKNTTCKKIFYSSSACMYPEHNQLDPNNPNCSEDSAYPANPDSEYGWEKLFSERLYLAYARNHGINVRIARFHNIYGPMGSWNNGKEKAPAAICRKVATAKNGDEVEIWGDGEQTRSFLYVDECLEGVRRLMESDWQGPVNIGSDEMVTINQLVDIACEVANKQLIKKHIPGPLGVRGRNSDNKLIGAKLGWQPNAPLKEGIEKTYKWIEEQVKKLDN